MFYKLLLYKNYLTAPLLIAVSFSLLSCAESVDRPRDAAIDGGKNVQTQQVLCSTHQDTFDNQVWPVLLNECFSCHKLNGVTSDLILLPESQNNYAKANFNTFQKVAAKIDDNGVSLLSVKPVNANNDHSGGAVLESGTAKFQAINDMVANLSSCQADTLIIADLDMGSDYQRLRKTTLALAGRLPTSEEEQQIEVTNDNAANKKIAFNNILDSLLTRSNPYYFERIKIMFNDLYLLDAFPDYRALGQFDLRNFANENYFDTAELDPIYTPDPRITTRRNTLRRYANRGLSQAPLELIAHVVREGKPFTEILTADYVMVNPYSAIIYNAKPTLNAGETTFQFTYNDNFEQPSADGFRDPDDFRAASLVDKNNTPIPHAGLLTSAAFLRRYPSTSTNRNRARSRVVYSYFLNINVLGLASRESLNLDNVIGKFPTFEDPQCRACHDTVDPIAGLFKNWRNRNSYQGDFLDWPYDGDAPQILAPGFSMAAADALPSTKTGEAVQWLAGRIIDSSGFSSRVVEIVFRGFTGQDLPVDFNFGKTLKANFVANNFDMKTLTKEIINSPYFKVTNLNTDADPTLFPDVGMGRLLTPELLDKKIQAVTGGYRWKSPLGRTLSDIRTYKLLYGGIDSDTVTTRTTTPTSLIAGAQQQIANQTACSVVPTDFDKTVDSRVLFPIAKVTDIPDNADGTQRIKENIIHLHKRILGELLAIDSVDVTRTYDLFVAVRGLSDDQGLPACRYRPSITKLLSDDVDKTIRPWMAVVTYLLSDYTFFYE